MIGQLIGRPTRLADSVRGIALPVARTDGRTNEEELTLRGHLALRVTRVPAYAKTSSPRGNEVHRHERHRHSPHLYVVYWPAPSVLKIGISTKFRWAPWQSRGGIEVAASDICCMPWAYRIEQYLHRVMRRHGEAFRMHLAGKVAEEGAEALAAYLHVTGWARRPGTWEQFDAELADTVISAFLAAVVNGRDLNAAIAAKHAVVMARGFKEPVATRARQDFCGTRPGHPPHGNCGGYPPSVATPTEPGVPSQAIHAMTRRDQPRNHHLENVRYCDRCGAQVEGPNAWGHDDHCSKRAVSAEQDGQR